MALERVGVEMVAEGKTAFIQSMNEGSKAVQGFGQNVAATAPGFSSFEQIATGAFRRVGEMAINASMEAGKALLGFAADSVTLAGDFEGTLNRFSSVTGASLAEAGYSVDDFSKLFLKLGADTQFSAQQAADAGVELAKGGVPIEQIMGDATEATLALAAAGELELAPAAEIVAKQLGVWGSTGVTATDAANLLAQAANASTVDVDELALGLANVGGTAKVAGVSFQDTVQTMALLAPGFSSAADAGTSFKTFLTRLIPSTDSATAAMEDLSLLTEDGASKFYDATGSFVGMEEASRLLADATKDLSEEQRLVAFQTIFGADAIRAAAIIAEQGATGFDAMGASMAKAGTASAQAAERNKGFKFAIEGLKGSLETLQIVIGSKILPLLTPLVKLVTDGVNIFYAFASGGDGAALAIKTFGDNLATMSPTLGKYFTILTSGRGVFDGLAAIAGDLLSRLGPLGTTAQNLINIFVRGQDSLANWEFLKRSTAALQAQLLSVGGAVLDFVVTTGGQILAAVPQIRQAFLDWGLAAVAWTIEAAPMLLDGLGQLLQGAIGWAVGAALQWGEQMLAFAQAAVAWIGPMLPGLGEQLGQFLNTMVTWVVDSLPAWMAQLQTLALAAVNWVQDALPGLGTNLGQMAGNILAWIAQTAIDVVPKLAAMGVKFVAWIVTDVLPELVPTLLKIGEAIGNFIFEAGVALGPKIHEFATKFYSWITDVVIPELPGLLGRAWDTISGWLSDIGGKALEGAKVVGQALIDGITDGVKAAAQGLYDATIGVVADALGGAAEFLGIQSPSTYARDLIGIHILPGIEAGIVATAPSLQQTLVDSLGAALDAGQATVLAGGQELMATLGRTLAQPIAGPGVDALLDAGRARRPDVGGFGSVGAGRIHPPASPGQIFSQASMTTNNGPTITYSPTYNSPAPPPAMSYAALSALAGV